jgi:hypothetical protein
LPDLPFDEDEPSYEVPEDEIHTPSLSPEDDDLPEGNPTGRLDPPDPNNRDKLEKVEEKEIPEQNKNNGKANIRSSTERTATKTDKKNAEDVFHVLTPTLPKAEPLPRIDQKPRRICIILDTCGDKRQDVRRLRRIHDILVSRPGRDQFVFRVRENGYWYEIDFPNVTTGLTETLIQKLQGLMGTNNIEITQTL